MAHHAPKRAHRTHTQETSWWTKRRVRAVLLGALIQAFFWGVVLYADPFGISTQSDRASEAIFLKLYSFLYPQFGPVEEPNNIVMVLFEEIPPPPGSKDKGATIQWPKPIAEHAKLLGTILAMKPKAVFLDIVFDSERDQDKAQTSQTLLDAIPVDAPPVFFASYAKDNPRRLNAPLQALPVIRDGGLPKPSKAYRVMVQTGRTPNHYVLQKDGELSPAAAIYNLVAAPEGKLPALERGGDESLLVFPSALPSYYREHPAATKGCAPYFDDRWGRIAGFFRALTIGLTGPLSGNADAPGGWNMLQPCMVFGKLGSDEFLQTDIDARHRLRSIVRDSYVIVGVNVPGLGDVLPTPAHGNVAGVYTHAMALDNLIRFQGRPFNTSANYFLWQVLLIFTASVIGKLALKGWNDAERPVRAILVRLAAWLAFAFGSGAIMIAFLCLHWAPYNWGGVFSVAGIVFLEGIGEHVSIIIHRSRQSMGKTT